MVPLDIINCLDWWTHRLHLLQGVLFHVPKPAMADNRGFPLGMRCALGMECMWATSGTHISGQLTSVILNCWR